MEDKNEKNQLELYEKILDRSDKEINRVHSMYKLAASLVTICATIIIGLGAFIFFSNMNEAKEDASKRVDKLIEDTNKDVGELKLSVITEMNQAKDSIKASFLKNIIEVETEVNKRIDSEFDKENISLMVSNTASERIDNIADELIERTVNNKIRPELSKTENNILELEFRLTEIAVMNDYRKAFDKITLWANDKNHLFHNEAVALRNKILNVDYSYDFSLVTYLITSDKNEFTGTIDELKKIYHSVTKEQKLNLIFEVRRNKHFNRDEKIIFLIEIIEADENLSCVYSASSIIINEFKLNLKPLEIDKVLEWWRNNKNKI